MQVARPRKRRTFSRWALAALTGLLAVGGVLTNPAPALAAIGEPAGVTVTPGRRLIKVEWTAPTGGGATTYNAKASTGETCTSAGLTCTLTPVAANTPILVSVQACPDSPEDCSTWKDAAATVKAGPPATPPAPTVTYASDDQTSMHLSWTENDEGAGIASYRVTPSTAFTTQTGSCTTLVSGTSCDVAGLTAGVSYTFKLTAIGINNATGSTGSSGVGPASTPKYVGLPGTPDAPTITQDSDTAVTVSWTKPSGPGAAISGYTVQKTTGGQSTDGCTAAADATQCQVTGLDPTLTYTFKVRANGEGAFGGSSAYSGDSAALTPGKPNTPDAPTVELGAAAGQVRVNWTPPDGGGSVTGYVVTPYSIVDQSPPAPCVKDAAARYCDFDGLDDGVAYTFKVVAKGAVDSDASAASESIISQLPAKPNAPTAALVAGTPGAVRLTWAPQNTGGPVIFYTVAVLPATGNQTGATATGCGSNLTTPTCTITGLDPTVSYTFRVTAVGDLGTALSDASAPIVPNKPNAATSPTVTYDNPTAATVHWTPPDGGGVVESYTVTATPSDGTTATVACNAVSSGTTSCPFTGLTASKSYTFKVTATNAAGSSDHNADVAVPDKPSSPQDVTVALTASTPGSVDVSWTAPANGTADHYVVTVAPTDASTPPDGCTTASTNCTIGSLDTAKSYTFTVRAENILGGSDASPTAAVIPDQPGAPGSVAVTVPASGQATVTWEPPASGGAVADYVVSATSSDGDANIPPDCTKTSTDQRSCTFSLDGDKPYAFTVKAVNAAGDQSAAATAEIVPGAPGAPTSVVAALVSNTPGAITVTWGAPLGAAAVTKYVVTPAADDVNAVDPGACEVTPPAPLSCSFTGLTRTASYTFTVRAQNGAGGTDASDTAALMPDKPGAPAGVTATRGNAAGKVVVTWPAAGGGAVGTYTVTPESTDVAASTPAGCTVNGGDPRTCTITGLTPSAPYTFKVTATNTAGSSNASSTPALVPNVPDKPNVTVTVGAPGSATVTWDEPAATSAPPTGGWVVTPTSTDGGATPSPSTCSVNWGGPRTCAFTNLTTSASYSFQVRATNEAGYTDSEPTAPVVANKPNAPGAPTAQITAPDKVRLTWTAPVGGGPVTKYNVDAYPAGAPDTPVTRSGACTDVTALTCEFDGLSDSLVYTFRVTATGSGGNTQGDRSVEVNMVGPGEPAAPTVALEGTNAVRVTWTAPGSGGPVTSYSVTADPDLSAPARCTNVKVLTCLFDRLNPGTEYTFKVYANGTADRSTASGDSMKIMVPAVVSKPDAPGTPDVEVTAPDKVRLSWTAPAGGGPAATYTAEAFTAGAQDTPIAFGDCTAITTLTCEFGDLSESETYTFRVTATGPGGDTQGDRSKPVTTAGPGKPAMPSVELAGPRAVKVTWVAPSGGPVTGYSVTATPDVSAPARCTEVKALSCVFDRLTSGTAYTFTITAYGTADRSTESDASSEIIPGPPGTPPAPTVALTDKTGQIRVTWTAPAAGGPITGYQVQANPGGLGCADPVGPTDTFCFVRGLDSATSYSFQVKALGAAGGGDSAYGPASVAITPGASAAPTDVEVAPGDRQIAVSWTAPSTAETEDSRVDHYRAVATPGGNYCETSTDTECIITDLANLTSYTVTVNAITAGGLSTPSAPSARVRPTAGRPGTPTAVQATIADTRTVVSWTAPPAGGSDIAWYTATAVGPNGTQKSCTTPNGTTLSCTITGLTNGTPYSVTVVSVGRAASGYSAPSTAVTVTPRTPPGAPTGVTVTPGTVAKSLIVKWSAGSPSDGVTGYTATAGTGTSAPSCSTTSATVLTCTISGLTPGVYSVTVVAKSVGVNSAPSAAVDATAQLAVAPTLTSTQPASGGTLSLSPTTAKVGGTVTVSGSGFAPFTGVAVALYAGGIKLGTATTNANGAFSVDVTIPTGTTTGSKTVVAAAQTSATVTTVKYLTGALSVQAVA